MSDKVDGAKLNFHVAVLAVIAAGIDDGSVPAKYGAQRIRHELEELCKTASLNPVTVSSGGKTSLSVSPQGD